MPPGKLRSRPCAGLHMCVHVCMRVRVHACAHHVPAGVDFKLKSVVVNGKHVKLTIWDTAGQERFRTLTSSYYRGAQGVILVYDVTRRETFSSLAELWLKEVDMYSNVPACVLMLVANKTDQESARQVSREEGIEFARQCGSLFLECSAKTRVNVQQCFSELVQKILETPALTNPKPSASNSGIISSLHPSPSTNEGEGCLC
eukprot:TRINITY_DN18218_c0_g2_i2.p1 TRINITY_DN18218_c0_g2~~TRINITY_DN18218_c0_g2_i2.p1  ORF type:complete len:202 (+),score=5.25 TRINITY_DN18218_c0_g2_i2:52-657(+)